MSYLALYRKYRPVDFYDLVGQEEITESLRYQVQTSTFGHSYLFNGIRGTGKTSLAKVFAKAVNCLDPKDGNPCNQCASCVAFNQNAMMDVIEIDAASNNGVDDIREIRENSHFMPAGSKYKVYIIDEVQMLSTGAFNALLKTLEEPSRQVIFVLATTELHKIPETILSRCQRYTFRRIDEEAIVKRLAHIAQKEKVSYDGEALQILSEHAGGALRDAINLMDKTLSLSRGHLSEESVRQSLGLLGRDRTHKLLRMTFDGDVEGAMEEVAAILSDGKEIGMIYEEILYFLRGLLMYRFLRQRHVIEKIISYSMEKFAPSYEDVQVEELQDSIRLFEESHRKLRFSGMPRLSLELALIEVAQGRGGIEKTEVKRVIEKRQIEVIKEEVIPEELDPEDLQPFWERVLQEIKKRGEQNLFFLLAEGQLKELREDTLLLEYPEESTYFVQQIGEEKNRNIISSALREISGKNLRLRAYHREKEVKTLSEEDRLRAFLGSDADKLIIKR